MNEKRPTRCPCSADSSRKAGPASRSLRNADTGVSQSAMKVWRSAIRLYSRARARTVARSGSTARSGLATTATEDLRSVGESTPPAAQQHGQVIEHVGGLLVHAKV